MTKCISIYVDDIPKSPKYMLSPNGTLDLLGQILQIGYSIKVHNHSETPANQETLLHPFTQLVRGRVHLTELSITLIRNDSLPGSRQVEEANKLLEEYDILLEVMK